MKVWLFLLLSALGAGLTGFGLAGAGPAHAATLPEIPLFAEAVRAGKLPPMEKRLPDRPRVVGPAIDGAETPQYGGVLRLLMGDQRDIRFSTVYAYTRLVTFNKKLELVPDLLESFDVENGRVFTLRLRAGHKWSDGNPFTTEDFRYYWENVANEPALSPGGPPRALLAGGKPARVEIVDPVTIRYSWDEPNPAFLVALAAAQPTYIYMPSHYMKQFHPKFSDMATIQAAVKAARVKDWRALHEQKSRQYRPENPALPALDPWTAQTAPPSEMFTFRRNPYFHRVDQKGRQLPYIDEVRMTTGTSSLIPAKVASGEADLQGRYIRFDSYTFLKEAEQRSNYKVRLWERGEGATVALLPNLNAADPVWRGLMRDVRVRRALSLGINRRDINHVIFFGLARESANTLLPQSPLFKPHLEKAFANFDRAEANRLLDEAGLDKRALDGIRLLPDGRRAEITVESAGENTEESDVLELVGHDWHELGIKLFARSTQRDVFRRRINSGQIIMSISTGLDNAIASPDMEPDGLAPMNQAQFQWPQWGLYTESVGREGQRPDVPEALELMDLHKQWLNSTTTEERRKIWDRMLVIHAEQIFTIGIINGSSQPVVVSNRLRNVPEQAVFSFEPGAFFGVYMPDTFWFVDAAGGKKP
jgi:peptide/nickel transport system substrate-binding protein